MIPPWIANPPWQNFSSMFREAITTLEARTGMERSHHLTASLYFGIAALEAFLNQRMREHMEGKSEDDTFDLLKNEQIISKLKKWPSEILGKPLNVRPETVELIVLFNKIRGNLTHPKTHGHDIYAQLEAIDPSSVIISIAEYIVRFHETEGTKYPYWLFGWNHLNPSTDSYEIRITNETEFCFSAQALGFRVSTGVDSWLDKYFRTFDGYMAVSDTLGTLDRCEPKSRRFPHKFILCRRWWTDEHQQTCGRVTGEAIKAARDYWRTR